MEEAAYQLLADETFRRIGDVFDDVDPDAVDCEIAGDVITLTFADKKRCIVNTQRPTRQIWMAANARAWHFTYDDAKRVWMDDKGQGSELFATIARVVKEAAGIDVKV